ncbi:unnamed protein product [Mytilus edulis]|uniref:SWIM-type domain-containing protein n=1 Tax=Mytilus edulis TaxID=6550 RepID=A0A8S3SCE0_MYTED|nr:unnamed protein product [Mytilus edulis]
MADNSNSISPEQLYSSYVNSLTPDAKQRYQTKLLYAYGTKSLPDPYVLTDKWSTNPCTWPDLTFGDIYVYLIDTPSIYTKDSMKAYKSLEAYNFVVSGHVQVVLTHQVSDDSPFIAIKAKVTPSQRAREKPHQPWVYLDKASAAVYCAHCTCMAGLGEVCSHVGALLFKIEMGVKMGLTLSSSTSKACQWNSTFRKEVIPATVTEICDKIKGKRTKEVVSIQADGSSFLPQPEVLDELYALVPNAAFFTSVTAPSQIVESQPVATYTEKYPKLLQSLQDPDISDINIDSHCKDIFSGYLCSDYQATNLEAATRNQAISPLWFQHRMGRVTASKAHDVWTRKDTTSPDVLVKRIVGYSSYDLSKKAAVKWGVDHEEECRQAYITNQSTQHIDFECNLSGFTINNQHPFLGASPDGITNCQCCGKGLIEIKCPYKHKDITVMQAASSDKDFCLDKSLHLKTNHRYYTQVQFQMFILQLTFCDFVVYTKCKPSPSMVIVRVPIDVNFCHALISKCELFVKTYVIRVSHQTAGKPTTSHNTTTRRKQQRKRDMVFMCRTRIRQNDQVRQI